MESKSLSDRIGDKYKDSDRREYSELKKAFYEGIRDEKWWQTNSDLGRYYGSQHRLDTRKEEFEGALNDDAEAEMKVRGRIHYVLNNPDDCNDVFSGVVFDAASSASNAGLLSSSILVRKKILDAMSTPSDFTSVAYFASKTGLMDNRVFQEEFATRFHSQLSSPKDKREVMKYLQEKETEYRSDEKSIS